MYYANPNLSIREARVLNLASMTLNQSPNITDNYFNILDTFKVFSSILKDSGASDEFSKSLKHSQNYIDFLFSRGYPNAKINEKVFFSELKSQLKTLEKDTTDSLLLIPLHTNSHIFSGTLRKISKKNIFGMNSSSYSFLVTNAGSRGDEKTHIEYKFNSKKEIEKVLHNLNNSKFKQPKDIYKYLDEKSFEKHDLNIKVREQSVGNCWVKEFEKGMKTSLIPYDVIQSAQNNMSIYAGYEEVIQKTTLEMHTKFIDELKSIHSNNPNIQKGIDDIFDDYLINKDLRDRVKGQKTALEEFDPRKAILKMDTRNIKKFSQEYTYFVKVFRVLDEPLRDTFKKHLDHLYDVEKDANLILETYKETATNNLSIDEKYKSINEMYAKSKDLITHMEKRNLMNVAPNFYHEKKMQLSEELTYKCKDLLNRLLNEENKEVEKGIKKTNQANVEKSDPTNTFKNALYNIEKFNLQNRLKKLETIKEISDYSKKLLPIDIYAMNVSRDSKEHIEKTKKTLIELNEKIQTLSTHTPENSELKFEHQTKTNEKSYTMVEAANDMLKVEKKYGQMSVEQLRGEIKTLEKLVTKDTKDSVNVTNLHTSLRSLKRKSIVDRPECEKKLEHIETSIFNVKKEFYASKDNPKNNLPLKKEHKGITL